MRWFGVEYFLIWINICCIVASRNLTGTSLGFSNGTATQRNRILTTNAPDCSASWQSWFSSSINYTFWHTYSSYSTYTYRNITAQIETLCDGHPRIIGGSNALTTVGTGTTSTLTFGHLNYTAVTPNCRLAPSDCTSLYGQYNITASMPCVSPSSTSSTSLPVADCGPCTIWGGTVQLLYFPVTQSTSRNLCPTNSPGTPTLCPLAPTLHPYSVSNAFEMSPCAYATQNQTSTTDSGPHIVSGGSTFYQNRAYVSIQTAFASNMCGYVGKQHAGTVLTLKSSDVYSIAGYHHELQDIGYQVNFEDFTSVPAEAYYMACNGADAASCEYRGSRYRYGTDYINGVNTADFGVAFEYAMNGGYVISEEWIWDEAYAPTLLLPLQIRDLDTAWATCSLNLAGLYDPPRALSQVSAMATPTLPGTSEPAAASPAGSPTAGDAPETADTGIAPTITQPKGESRPSGAPFEGNTAASPMSPNPTIRNGDSGLPMSSDNHASSDNEPYSSQLSLESPANLPPHPEIAPNHAQSTTNAMSVLMSAERTFPGPNPVTHSGFGPVTDVPLPNPVASEPTANTYTISNTAIPNNPMHTSTLLPPIVFQPSSVTFIADGRTHTVAAVPSDNGVYEIDNSITISGGDAAFTADGVPFSIGRSGGLIAGSKTITLPTEPGSDSSAYRHTSSPAHQSAPSTTNFSPEATITTSSAASVSRWTRQNRLNIQCALAIAVLMICLGR